LGSGIEVWQLYKTCEILSEHSACDAVTSLPKEGSRPDIVRK